MISISQIQDPQRVFKEYNSTIFINPKIFVDVDGTLTFNKHG